MNDFVKTATKKFQRSKKKYKNALGSSPLLCFISCNANARFLKSLDKVYNKGRVKK